MHEDQEGQQQLQSQDVAIAGSGATAANAGSIDTEVQQPSKCDVCGVWCDFKMLRMMGKQGGGRWKCLSCKAGQEALAKHTNGWPPKGWSDFSEAEQQAIMQQSHSQDPPMVSKTPWVI